MLLQLQNSAVALVNNSAAAVTNHTAANAFVGVAAVVQGNGFAVANVATATVINFVVVSNDTTVAVVNVVELHLATNKRKGKMPFKYETIT